MKSGGSARSSSHPWSAALNDESLKPFDDDMENEEIPLVVRPLKHTTGGSGGGGLNKHQKKASTTFSESKSSTGGKKKCTVKTTEVVENENKTSARVNETYEGVCWARD